MTFDEGSHRIGRRWSGPVAAMIAGLCLTATPAVAGPPYLTDDPEPTDLGHWEIYNYGAGLNLHDGFSGQGGIDINYGAAKDLQLTAVFPLAVQNPSGLTARGLTGGPGVIELAAKYKIVHQAENGWVPDICIFPRVFVATDTRFGSGHPNLLLPVWAEKDFGPWSVFGGGGYQINPGADERGFWQGGVTVTRNMTKRLQLGAELFSQGPDTRHGGGYTALNLGLQYKLIEHWSLLASGGPVREQSGASGQVFYLALKADY